jgi:long-chain acyl-CoA synthetase
MTSATERETGNVSDLLSAAASAFPERSAVISSGGERSWSALDRAVNAGVGALRDAGLVPGDRVVVSLPTGPDIIAALFAVARAGLVAVPIGPHADLQAIAEKIGARGALTDRTGPAVPVRLAADQLLQWWEIDAQPAAASGGGEDIAVLARAASGARAVMVSHRAVLAAVAAIGQAPR